ncbi:MAG: hypothetical protein KUG77_03045 [Nannocystaceae bacterium]|nr:hypothetical protein [Nannocystaceae bacterium]
MSVRAIAVSLVLLCGCAPERADSVPTTTPAVAAPAEPQTPEYDPAAVASGVYRLDLASGIEAFAAALTLEERGEEVADVRHDLGEGHAWLVLDPGGETLLLYGTGAESMDVDVLSVATDASGFGLTLREHPERGAARCRATSEVRLECELDFAGSELRVPLPLVFERERTARPGLPEPGLYGWQPAQGVEEVADVDSMQESLVASGVGPLEARALAAELLSRPSLNIIEGDALWTLSDAITWSEDATQARIERVVFPVARMETTVDGFRIERRMPARPGAIIEDCRLMDAGFSCRSGGRESIYQRSATRLAR